MKNINDIVAVKVTIVRFMSLSVQRTEYMDFNLDGVTTYFKEKGKRKLFEFEETSIEKAQMKSFFKEIYDFVRGATDEDLLTDDQKCEVDIIYSMAHREILDGNTLRGTELLIDKLQKFVDDHRK